MPDRIAYDVTWVNAANQSFALEDAANGIYVLGPLLGVGTPPTRHVADELFGVQGEVWRNTRLQAREVTVPIAIVGDDEAVVLERFRALCSRLNPLTGDGYLVVRHHGAAYGRRVRARYMDGLLGEMQVEQEPGQTWTRAALVFRAFNPLWEDATELVIDFSIGGTVALPFFPMFADPSDVGPHFGTSTVFGATNVVNNGDVAVAPKWLIAGPAEGIVLTNLTTGEKIDLSAQGGVVIGGGESITIDVAEGTIVHSSGDNAFQYLTDDSTLWLLQVGQNIVSVNSSGATAGSLVRLRYRLAYLSF